MAKYLWAEDSYTNKRKLVRRSPSPDDRIIQMKQRTNQPDELADLVRQLPTAQLPGIIHPTDPHSTWISTSGAFPLGLIPGVVPPSVDLSSARVGRAFRCKLQGKEEFLALFPASQDNPLCPPYPGLRPDGIDDPTSPISCFSDGRQGKFDFRSYPQVYDSKVPWGPYHRAPVSFENWRLNERVDPWDRTQSRMQVDSKLDYEMLDETIHYAPVTEFFWWNEIGKPERGGNWNRRLINLLFVTRKHAQRYALARYSMIQHAKIAVDLSSLQLPWNDPVEWEDTLKWNTWAEGRDAIAHTCRHIAAMEAFGNWANEISKRPGRHIGDVRPKYDRFMGCWASTIPTQAVWEELQWAGIPVYVISTIPPNHSLMASVGEGALDAHERFRQNAYDSVHNLPNQWWSTPCYDFQQVQPTHSADQIPHHLTLPLQPEPTSVHGETDSSRHPSTSWYQSWTSYILLDQDVPTIYKRNISFRKDAIFTFWQQSGLLAPFLPAGKVVLNIEHHLHPFFYVCPKARDRGLAQYIEKYDQDSQVWWFQRFNSRSPTSVIKEADNMPYCFHYPLQRTTIYSDYPFPGQNYFFCRVSGGSSTVSMAAPIAQRSYYYKQPPCDNNKTYTWSAPEDQNSPAPPTAADMADFLAHPLVTNMSQPGDDYQSDMFGADNEGILVHGGQDPVHNDIDRVSPTQQLEYLLQQRSAVASEFLRQLFEPIKGIELQSSAVRPWLVPKSSNSAIVWPLRILGFHGDAHMENVLEVLVTTCHIREVDIMLVSSYGEIDTTKTVEVGLRHYEDALWIWSLLHGVLVDERYLYVTPISAMKGKGIVPNFGIENQLSPTFRLERARSLASLSDLWPTTHPSFEQQLHNFCSHMESLLNPSERDSTSHTAVTAEVIVHSLTSLVNLPFTPIQELCPPIGLDGEKSSFNGDDVDLSQAVVNHIEWVDTPLEQQPPQRKKRRLGESDPGLESNMTSNERKALRAALVKKANEIVENCVVTLPTFKPKSGFTKIKGETTRESTQRHLGELLTSWWDWLDRCKNFCQPENDLEASSCDWSKVDDVFGNLSKLQGVYGYEYKYCLALLQKRFEKSD